MQITKRLVLSLLAPGVVCLLVAVQIAYGLRGFADPRGGVAAILEVPGLLVGWGSMFFLVPLLVWLVLDWWGVSFSGIALKCLGATAVAIAVGSMFGIVGGVDAGGHLGAGLADLLTGTLGTGVSLALLGLMALPGLVLTCIGFLQHGEGETKTAPARAKKPRKARKTKTESPPAPASAAAPPAEPAEAPPKRSPLFKRKKKVSNLADLVRDSAKRERQPGEPWYPERRFDDSGNEMPMDFGEHRDVGGIRYADPGLDTEPEAEPETGTGTEDAELPAVEAAEAEASALPTIPELFAGDYDSDALEEELSGEASDDAAQKEDAASEEADAGARRHVDIANRATPLAPRAPGGDDRVVEGVGRVVGSAEPEDEPLMPGVRYAEPAPPPAQAAADDEEEAFDEEEEALGEIMRQTPTPAEPEPEAEEPEDTPSVKDSVLQALDGEAHTKSSQRYLEKLEASGIFDFMEGGADTSEAKPAKKQAAARRKAPAKPKAPARKKAAKKKATAKKAAKKKTAAKKAARKKKTTTHKASAVRKSEPKPAAKKKPTPPSVSIKEAKDTEHPSVPRDQWKTGSWRHGPHGIQASARPPERETVSASTRRRVIRERRDPLFTRAAQVCLDRGAASPVLLTRRLGIGYTQAKSLVERLVYTGVLGRMTPSGSHPTIMTPAQWTEASR